MRRLKHCLSILLMVLAFGSLPADAGHFEGNGGDYIRATFISMGSAVINHLKNTPDGQALADDFDLDVDALNNTLSIDVITVSDQPLVDNGGSAVDAIGVPGSITLSHNAWFEHFELNRDVYFLVFHEMLRAVGVDDDNYVISGAIRPFPEAEQIPTAIEDMVPLMDVDNVANYVDITQIAVNGSGCPSGYGTLTNFDSGRNILGLRMTDFKMALDPSVSKLSLVHRACTVSIQTKQLPAGKRIEAVMLDLLAEVDLQKNASFTYSEDAYLAGTTSPTVPVKTLTATGGEVAGRTILRNSNQLFVSPCGGGPTLLNFSANATLRQGAGATAATTGQLIDMQLSLRLGDCSQ